MNKKQFIKCSDQNTIDQLEALGYQLVDKTNGVATFINDTSKPQTFSVDKIVYSDKLTMVAP